MSRRSLSLTLLVWSAITQGCGSGAAPAVGGPPLSPPPPRSPHIIGTFSATDTPNFDHTFGAAVRLNDGRVLVTGGVSRTSAEIYDPSSGSFHVISNLLEGRRGHTATLLQNGTVFIAGGADNLRSAELYDPIAGQFSATIPMLDDNGGATATLLENGHVLLAGGNSSGSAEIFDPNSSSFSSATHLHYPRSGHTATKLSDGRVLFIGGYAPGTQSPVAVAEIYNPATNSFSDTASLLSARAGHNAILLGNGKVLVVGGETGVNHYLSSTELFSGGAFVVGPDMGGLRSRSTSTLLQSGRVLVAGGFYDLTLCNFDPCGRATATTQLYDPTTNSFLQSATMGTARALHEAVQLNGGKVLVVAGAEAAPGETFNE